jgi:outer membrane protein insertion porin family
MQKLMLAKHSLIFFSFLFFLLVSNLVKANDLLIIKGNKNISEKTIQSFAPKEINTFNPELINTFQKDLFRTGFFENVKITLNDNKLIIEVIENPLINFFFIEGLTNDNKKISDEINNLVKSKENTILQTYLIKEDIKNISNFLKNLGYLENKINYQLVKINDEKVNLFYNIKLQNKFKTKRIFFIGNKFFKSSVLKDVVLSEEHGWWKFLSNFTIPSESIINFDISKLKKFYLDNGFYDVQISSHSIKVLDNEYANIIYSINSGNRYIIDNIDFIDSLNLINDETITFLKNKYKNLLKNTYNASELEKYKNFSTEYLDKSNLNLIFRHKLDKIDNTKLKLSFLVLEQKNKKLVNKIIIKGNNITDDFVIRNKLSISEGDTFNSNKLNSSIDKIKDTFKYIENK